MRWNPVASVGATDEASFCCAADPTAKRMALRRARTTASTPHVTLSAGGRV
jgi:hypothetical protein